MYTKTIMGTEYGFTKEEISTGNFAYDLFVRKDEQMIQKCILIYTLNYKGEDEEEILCELFLRYFCDYILKSDQATSKQLVDSFGTWYKCGFKDGRLSV